jgi:hypothetical protein
MMRREKFSIANIYVPVKRRYVPVKRRATLKPETVQEIAQSILEVGQLPTTLSADESDRGLGVKMSFERVIVHPDGHREIEGVTPKQLPAPSPVSVENNDQLICVEKPSQNSASDDQ